jgi:HAD superfamily hydrolase (TIGR01662 family)
MPLGVILDLDQTIADSRAAAALRDARPINWQEVYKKISEFVAFEGICELIADLQGAGVKIGIVTSSPRPYCEKVLKHCGIDLADLVCFHDVPHGQRKPHPAPILKSCEMLGITVEDAIAVGDDPKDIQAAKAAGVMAVAATWGCLNRESLLAANPDVVCKSISELREIIFARVKK